ncbi:MAG TPA: hypothetical protein VJT73_00660 [Polyangiaceae bacterium]|nr:hypothetical protein [Polyangiaceae bacterium]
MAASSDCEKAALGAPLAKAKAIVCKERGDIEPDRRRRVQEVQNEYAPAILT